LTKNDPYAIKNIYGNQMSATHTAKPLPHKLKIWNTLIPFLKSNTASSAILHYSNYLETAWLENSFAPFVPVFG